MTVPEKVPASLVAGDTWEWTKDLPDYPRTTWTATFYFENKDKTFSVTGTGSTSVHSFSIPAATTAGYPAGRYLYRLRVNDGTTYKAIEQGWVEVGVDPAAAGTRDIRSDARKMLDALNATLIGKASNDQLSMSIQGRSLSRMSPAELMDWRDRVRSEVRAEEQAASAGLGRNIRVRFGRA